MFCGNCGKEIAESEKFCKYCGNKVELNQSNSDESFNYVNNTSKQEPDAIKNDKKPKKKVNPKKYFTKKIVIILIIFGFLLFGIVAAIVGFSIYQAPINDYNRAYQNMNSMKNWLKSEVNSANNKVSENSESTVADVQVINDLKAEIDNSNNMLNMQLPEEDLEYSLLKSKKEEADSLANQFDNQRNTLKDKENALENSKKAKMDALAKLQDVCSGIAKDQSGYEISYNVKASNWFKASETSRINAAWSSAGGHGDAPSMATFNSKYSDSFYAYNNESCCVLIGSASFENKTPNFHVSSTNKKNPGINLSISLTDKSYYEHSLYSKNNKTYSTKFAHAVNYWDNTDKTQYGSTQFSSSSIGNFVNQFINADMHEDKWGPVAFMIVVPGIFTPNSPNGDPVIDIIGFKFSPTFDTSTGTKQDVYVPKKTW